jgi:hypothetical protein
MTTAVSTSLGGSYGHKLSGTLRFGADSTEGFATLGGLSGEGSFATGQWMDLSRSLPSCYGVPRAVIGARRSRSQKTQIARITMTTRTNAAIAIVRLFMCPPRDWF